MLYLNVLCILYLIPLVYCGKLLGTDHGEVKEFTTRNGEAMLIRRNTERIHEIHKRCKCSCRSKYYNDGWYCCDCDDSCFPAVSMVLLHNGQYVHMDALQKGDQVLTATPEGELIFCEVRTFLKRQPEVLSDYVSITTNSGHMIRLSESHLIYAQLQNNDKFEHLYASEVGIDDLILVTGNGTLTPARVTNISSSVMQGAYVPLTMEGTIIVDDIFASCYASFNHQVAHAAMTPLRWYPQLFEWLLGTTADGAALYVDAVKGFGRWILPSSLQDKNPYVLTFLGFNS